MDNYQLAKLVQWAGTLHTRKKMQKVVFLLQAAGCPFDADYFLHHYGPYSTDVARLTDSLVNNNLLNEEPTENMAGKQYEYTLPPDSRASLERFEKTPEGTKRLAEMTRYEDLARDLLNREVFELEYGATIAYFRRRGQSWEDAFAAACRFKRLASGSPAAKSALALARTVMEPSG